MEALGCEWPPISEVEVGRGDELLEQCQHVGLHFCYWTCVPALSIPNADSLAHLVGLGPLDEEVHALSGPADQLTSQHQGTKEARVMASLSASDGRVFQKRGG